MERYQTPILDILFYEAKGIEPEMQIIRKLVHKLRKGEGELVVEGCKAANLLTPDYPLRESLVEISTKHIPPGPLEYFDPAEGIKRKLKQKG